MRALLDTHTSLWWLADSESLSDRAYGALADEVNTIAVSAASAWEIATKHRLGRLPSADALAYDIGAYIAGQGFDEMAITVDDVSRAGALPGHHRDPFDRMLIAQALTRDIVLISNESLFDLYGVRRLW
ncbi:MAG: type II toxin-antitoxin system VapC family toxin [Dehalococcoidia bacterium]|nr:type II toxin-antitoxin system VapC family toxin [Dehalococcoidia bacterium]